jgi:hypothetical protein
MANSMRRELLAKALFDLSKYTMIIGLVAFVLNKLNWMSGIALTAIAIVAAVAGMYAFPKGKNNL